ncbi:MAG: MAPEG family protein [Marinibacterium sp.]|nr:MAPEG family protein [Marinibacterium sp.]
MTEQFDAYGHAIAALALMVLFWAVIGPVSAIVKERSGAAPGGSVPEDYGNRAYRWQRTYANFVETLPAFVAALVAAILAGASPFWINLFASVFALSRFVMAFIHVRGFGNPISGLRSMSFTVGWAMIILMAGFALWAVL